MRRPPRDSRGGASTRRSTAALTALGYRFYPMPGSEVPSFFCKRFAAGQRSGAITLLAGVRPADRRGRARGLPLERDAARQIAAGRGGLVGRAANLRTAHADARRAHRQLRPARSGRPPRRSCPSSMRSGSRAARPARSAVRTSRSMSTAPALRQARTASSAAPLRSAPDPPAPAGPHRPGVRLVLRARAVARHDAGTAPDRAPVDDRLVRGDPVDAAARVAGGAELGVHGRARRRGRR